MNVIDYITITCNLTKMTDYRLHPITWKNVIDYKLRLHHVSLPAYTGRCRFTHTWHTFQWRLMTCRWDNANFNMKHIPSGYQVNFSHDLQAERNEQFTSHSYQFNARWKKMSLFCHHIIIKTTLNCSISKWKTKWYTAEIHVSRMCTLKDHFFETFLILCETTYNPIQTRMVMNVAYCFKNKTNFESTLKKTKVLKNHWIINISLTYGYMQSICVMLKMCHLSKDSWDPTCTFFLS